MIVICRDFQQAVDPCHTTLQRPPRGLFSYPGVSKGGVRHPPENTILRCLGPGFEVQWFRGPPRSQISFEPGFGAYQSLAQKLKVPFLRIFSFFLQF